MIVAVSVTIWPDTEGLADEATADVDFARAEKDCRRALDRLRQLDREGKLEGRPAFKYRHVKALEREIEFCAAAPHVLEDAIAAGSQIPYVSIKLLGLRARRLADQGRLAELVATVEALSAFQEGDGEDQYILARTLAWFVPLFENDRLTGLTAPQRCDLKNRCTVGTVAALGRAFDRGFPDVFQLDAQVDLDPIRRDPGFRALVERLRARRAPGN